MNYLDFFFSFFFIIRTGPDAVAVEVAVLGTIACCFLFCGISEVVAVDTDLTSIEGRTEPTSLISLFSKK